MGNMPQGEVVLAAASGSAGGLGKVGTLLASGTMYVRCDNTGFGRSDHATWRVQCDKAHAVQLYRARSVVDSVTVTLGSMADGETGPLVNGLTYQAEDTAALAAWATRYYYTGGANDTADALQLAKLMNADYAVTTAGTSVAATDKLIITTDEGAHTLAAAAAADYPAGKYKLSATVATELASIILAINHRDNVTCSAAVTTGHKVTIKANGKTYVFTAAAAEAKATRSFDNDAGANATATSLAACINDATYGVPGITAVAASAVVSLERDSMADTFTVTSSSATTLAVEKGGGVPGVTAVATGATGELGITPTWTKTLTVDEAGTKLTVVDIDLPGIYATPAAAVVTLVPGTPATGGEKASVIAAKTGTGAAHCAVAQTATLLGLAIDGSATSAVADNSTTAGKLYDVWVDGWDALYCAVTNSDAVNAATVTVAATRY